MDEYYFPGDGMPESIDDQIDRHARDEAIIRCAERELARIEAEEIRQQRREFFARRRLQEKINRDLGLD